MASQHRANGAARRRLVPPLFAGRAHQLDWRRSPPISRPPLPTFDGSARRRLPNAGRPAFERRTPTADVRFQEAPSADLSNRPLGRQDKISRDLDRVADRDGAWFLWTSTLLRMSAHRVRSAEQPHCAQWRAAQILLLPDRRTRRSLRWNNCSRAPRNWHRSKALRSNPWTRCGLGAR